MPKRLILRGRVQGVMCRNLCSKYGKRLKLEGAASNLPNGAVEVILGTEDDDIIDEYIKLIMNNPRKEIFWGSVDNVEASDYAGPIQGDFEF
ncbi:MAG: acylphosphatase [bacterium]|nr:acylphosphatase [bacterium]